VTGRLRCTDEVDLTKKQSLIQTVRYVVDVRQTDDACCHRCPPSDIRGSNYDEHLTKLQAVLRDADLAWTGEAVYARYNPPFTPWFTRRNEIGAALGIAART